MKKSIAIFSLFALAFVFGAGDAFAADAVNKNNDADSNRAYASSDSSVYVGNDLDADIDNDVEVDAETGENEANENSGDVFIWTGGAMAGSVLTNNANNVLTDILLGCGCENGAYAANINNGDDDRGRRHHRWGRHHRGDDGENTARAESNSSIVVENDVDADVENDVEVEGETGENEANGNGGEFNEQVNRSSSESTFFNSYDEEERFSEGEESESSRSHRARRHHRWHPWFPGQSGSSSESSSSWSDWSYDNAQVTDTWDANSEFSRSTSYPMGGNVEILTGDATAGSEAETNVNLIQTFVSRGL